MDSNPNPDSLLFVRHPDGQWLVGWGMMTRLSAAPATHSAFYLPDFFGEDLHPWWQPEHFAAFSTSELLHRFPRLNSSLEASAWEWQEPVQDPFAAEVESLLNAISRGELRKAVPMVMSIAQRLPTLHERMVWWARTLKVPSRWIAYGGWWGEEGLIGLSPEILFSTQIGWTETMALAGTAPNPGPSLLESEKDLREHRLVVEDITRQLSELGEVKSTPVREWALGKLKHLRTDLAVAEGASFERLVALLHPTPALGVAPREAGVEWLRKAGFAEQRRRFGAPFGVSIPEEFGFACVAIRGIQWHEGRTWLSSGCGVVAGSEPEREWRELQLKRQVVRDQFALGPA